MDATQVGSIPSCCAAYCAYGATLLANADGLEASMPPVGAVVALGSAADVSGVAVGVGRPVEAGGVCGAVCAGCAGLSRFWICCSAQFAPVLAMSVDVGAGVGLGVGNGGVSGIGGGAGGCAVGSGGGLTGSESCGCPTPRGGVCGAVGIGSGVGAGSGGG